MLKQKHILVLFVVILSIATDRAYANDGNVFQLVSHIGDKVSALGNHKKELEVLYNKITDDNRKGYIFIAISSIECSGKTLWLCSELLGESQFICDHNKEKHYKHIIKVITTSLNSLDDELDLLIKIERSIGNRQVEYQINEAIVMIRDIIDSLHRGIQMIHN